MLNITQMDEQSFWQAHCEPSITERETRKYDNFIDYLSHNLSDKSMSPFAVRFVPSFHRDIERWDVAGRRAFFALETQNNLNNIIPVHYNNDGNIFVFYMEYFCRLITDSIDSVIHNNHSLNKAKDYKDDYDDYITRISKLSHLSYKHEALLAKRLNDLKKWAKNANVEKDAQIFFEAYTLGYFGDALKLSELAIIT